MKKEWITELIWIIFLFAITLLIDFLLFGDFSILKDKVDIQLHDTFYVISGIAWIFAVFILIATPAYILKEAKRGYNHVLPNLILTILIIAMLFLILHWHRNTYSMHSMNDWKVYPPLSASPEIIETIPKTPLELWSMVFSGIELIMMIGLFLLGVKTGRLTNIIKNENIG